MISKISAQLDHSKGARENSVNLSFGNPLGSLICLVIYLWGCLAHCCSVSALNRSVARVELETLNSLYVLECWRSFLLKLLLVQKRLWFCHPNWFRDFCFFRNSNLAVALRKPGWNIGVVFGWALKRFHPCPEWDSWSGCLHYWGVIICYVQTVVPLNHPTLMFFLACVLIQKFLSGLPAT